MLPPIIPTRQRAVSYRVAPEDDLFHTRTWRRWSVRVLKDVLSCIIFPVGIFRLCATYFGFVTASLHSKEKIRRYCEISQGELPEGEYGLQRVTIQTADGVALDTVAIENGEQKGSEEQKWIVYFNGNGACWEKTLPDQVRLALATGAHVFTGNYRGVGESRALALSAQDLLVDGEAMVQYLLKVQGIKPENILLYGWSMGAVVASELAALHPEMAHVNDRSFASTYLQVKNLIGGVFGSLMGEFAARITCAVGWTFNTAQSYLKAGKRKFIVYCKEDSIIPYCASVYRAVENTQPERILLRRGKVRVQHIQRPKVELKITFFNFVSGAFLKIRKWYVGQDMEGYHTHIAPLTGSSKYTWELEIFDAFCSKVRAILELPERQRGVI